MNRNRNRNIAIIVRAHGGIPTRIDNKIAINDEQLQTVVDIKRFSELKKPIQLVTVALSKLGGVCYGSPDIEPFINSVNTWYTQHLNNTENKIHEIFGPNPPETIKTTRDRLIGISFSPVITDNTNDLYLNKEYTKFNDKSGVFILASENINIADLPMINGQLDVLNSNIRNNIKVSKTDILNIFSPYIDKLYFIDFTCSAYINHPSMPPLTQDYVNWMNGVFNHHKIMGGKTKKSKNKMRIKRSRRNNNKTRINRSNLAKKKRSSRR